MVLRAKNDVIESVRRAFLVLEVLNRRTSTTLTVLAAESGLPRPTLLVKRLRLEGESAFRALDGPLLQVVKTRGAAWTNAFGSEISLDQGHYIRL